TSSLRPLSIILAQAARKGQIAVNPMTQLERGERPKHDDERPKRILTLEEMHALIAATESLQMRCLFELMLATGLRIGEALGLTAPAPTLHDLRHSHASMLIALDYSVVDVQHRLGHRKPDTTLRVYTHQWKYRDAQKSRIGDHIGRLFTDTHQHQLRPGKQLALPRAR